MTAHHQYLPACKCPSCQGRWSSLDPHWSSSWACPSPPPADTHGNGIAHKGEEKAVWNVLSVPFGPNLPYTHSPVRAVLCRWQDEFQHQPRWSHSPETIIHRVSEEQRSCFCSWATASVTSPSHLLIELNHAFLADVIGPNDGQWIKSRDRKTAEVKQTQEEAEQRSI